MCVQDVGGLNPTTVVLISVAVRISLGVAFGAFPDPLRVRHAQLSCFPGSTDKFKMTLQRVAFPVPSNKGFPASWLVLGV